MANSRFFSTFAPRNNNKENKIMKAENINFLANRLAFIVCDEDESLHLFTTPPVKGFFNWKSNGVGHCFDIDESYCEDLGIDVPTWNDDEPIEVEVDIHISKHEE